MIHDIQSAFVKLYLIYFGIFWLKVILEVICATII